MSQDTVGAAISSGEGKIQALAKSELTVPQLVREVYLATYNRLPKEEELKTAARFYSAPGATRQTATEDLAWALINSAEFVFNH